MAVVSVSPGSGSGSQQTFTLQFADGAGATDWSTRAANQLNPIIDSGSAWLPATSGGSGTLTNSQCSVNLAAGSVTISGNTPTLKLPLTFTTAFSGAENIYMCAAGSAANSGWQTMGT